MTSTYPHDNFPGRLPPITQIAYLVPDLHMAIEFWAQKLNVGPFKILSHLQYAEIEYQAKPVDLDLSIALAWGNGVQIELMQQHSDAPTVFTDFTTAAGGFHHVGIHTDDLIRDDQRLRDAGFQKLQRQLSITGTETIFFGGIPMAGIVELIHTRGGSQLSNLLKEAAAAWDGTDPILR